MRWLPMILIRKSLSFCILNAQDESYFFLCFECNELSLQMLSVYELIWNEVQTDGKNAQFLGSLKIIDYQNFTRLVSKCVVKQHKNIV